MSLSLQAFAQVIERLLDEQPRDERVENEASPPILLSTDWSVPCVDEDREGYTSYCQTGRGRGTTSAKRCAVSVRAFQVHPSYTWTKLRV